MVSKEEEGNWLNLALSDRFLNYSIYININYGSTLRYTDINYYVINSWFLHLFSALSHISEMIYDNYNMSESQTTVS